MRAQSNAVKAVSYRRVVESMCIGRMEGETGKDGLVVEKFNVVPLYVLKSMNPVDTSLQGLC